MLYFIRIISLYLKKITTLAVPAYDCEIVQTPTNATGATNASVTYGYDGARRFSNIVISDMEYKIRTKMSPLQKKPYLLSALKRWD